ncbi:MAG: cyclic nucleotide-binding domain-containing protein [Acidobacteria bacterium]|nr:cyclic nucleotide-binding domain-containing protein [Acidobacteriota bacterium]
MGNIVSRLGAFEFFAGLGDQELAFIATNCSELTVPSGSILIQQGQVGKDVYLLEEGSVRVYRGTPESPKILATLQAPTILGEMAVLDPARIRTSSVSALSDLRLLSIPIGTFLVLVGVYPSLKEKLRQVIAARR